MFIIVFVNDVFSHIECKDSVFSLTMQIFPEIIWLVPSKPLSLHRQVKLKNNGMNSIESNKGEIVMYQPDETIRLEVRVESETVWLNQAQMACYRGTVLLLCNLSSRIMARLR